MNIFEGSRRIALVIGLLGAVVSGVGVYHKKPSVEYKSFMPVANQPLKEVPFCLADFRVRAEILRKNDDADAYTWVCTNEKLDFVMLPENQLPGLEDAISKKRWSDLGEGAGAILAGLALWYVAVWSTGWIIRGFLGIPRGRDHRITPAQPN